MTCGVILYIAFAVYMLCELEKYEARKERRKRRNERYANTYKQLINK